MQWSKHLGKCVRVTSCWNLALGLEIQTKLGDALRTTLGKSVILNCVDTKATNEMKDLDEVTTDEVVTSSVNRILEGNVEANVFGSRDNLRGQMMATVTLTAEKAEVLLANRSLKIGWANCRIRPKIMVSRSSICLEFGHVVAKSTGPDHRRKLCYKCGCEDNRVSECNYSMTCLVCAASSITPEKTTHVSSPTHCCGGISVSISEDS